MVGKIFFSFCSVWALCVLCLSTGCVTPPVLVHPSIITQEELSYISKVRSGRLFTDERKFDKAEAQFRQSLAIFPEAASSHNDLGFVLQEQNRLSEAVFYFRRAIELDPKALLPRDNLARALYRLGDYPGAAEAYYEYLDVFYDKPDYGSDGKNESQLKAILRNLGTILVFLGQADEGLCYAKAGVGGADPWGSFSSYVHHMYYLGMYKQAFLYQQEVINANAQAKIPVDVIFDYVASCLLVGEDVLAADLASIQIQNSSLKPQELAVALALHSLAAKWTQPTGLDDAEDIDLAIEGILKTCKDGLNYGKDYLPTEILEKLGNSFARICEYGNKRFAQ